MERIPWEVYKMKFSDAYIAGFFDGDGSLVATLNKPPKYWKRSLRPRLKINFTQHSRHLKMLKCLQKYLDMGHVRISKSGNLAELVITDRKHIGILIQRLLPHLIIKKKQAELALKIVRMYGSNSRLNRISDNTYELIIQNVSKIRALNSGTGEKTHFNLYDPVTTTLIKKSELAL